MNDTNCGQEVGGIPCGVIVMEASTLIGPLLFFQAGIRAAEKEPAADKVSY